MNIDSAIRSSTSDDWEYLAEGGAHLVFAYRGPSPFLKSKVMRVRKDRLSGAPEVQQQDTSYDVARDYLSHRIMPSLVPPDILPTEGRFTVNKKWIQKLLDSSNDARPASRLSSSNVPPVKSNSNTLNNDVIEVSLVENLLGGESDLAVEIKPKCGFLPASRFLSKASQPIKTTRCRFCLHRYLRATEHRQEQADTGHNDGQAVPCPERDVEEYLIDRRHRRQGIQWDYCPLDLYSLDRRRRLHAVRELYSSWQSTGGEGNNMRLYASGSAIRPATYLFDTSSRIGSTPGVNPTASRNHDDTSPDNATGRTGLTLPDELRDQLCEAIVNALDDTRVLPLLKALQQEFDPIGIEGLAQIAKDHHECEGGEILSQPQHQVTTNVFSDSLLGDPSSAELEAVQQFWLSAQSRRPISSEKPDEGEKETEAEPQLPLPTDLRTLLVRHGISAIFKDCSIIIRFPGALRNHQPGSDALAFELVNSPSAILKIIDLDLKPLKKANKWYELDDRIWRNALQPDFCGVHPLLQRLCVS